ncbi:MAG: hypothetical protein JO342_18980 [Solirubrobacterales bacterium]|nr:hypothetical protein [Solirubrobacterales bacterium]
MVFGEKQLGPDAEGFVVAARARKRDRLAARLRSSHLDQALAAGEPSEGTPALALRARRLVALPRRRSIAESYREIVREASEGPCQSHLRVAPHHGRVTAASDDLISLAERLARPGPVAPRGVAQALLLLGDGTGPLYNRASEASLSVEAASAAANLSAGLV